MFTISNKSKNPYYYQKNKMNSYLSENSINLLKLYNYPTNMIAILLINYLLITMNASIKITKWFYGPMRTKYEWMNQTNISPYF